MIDTTDVPRRVGVMWTIGGIVFLLVAVALLLSGEVVGALGFATAAVACVGTVIAAERWRTWQRVAESAPGYFMDAPPDEPLS